MSSKFYLLINQQMTLFLELYRITLDFIYKISGPMIAITIIGFIIIYRQDLASFISKNIAKISGKVAGQNFEIDFNKLKESQSEPVKAIEKHQEVEKLRQELEFERIYSVIFGSQIEFLKLLRSSSQKQGAFVSQFEFLLFFDNVQENYKIFESWSPLEFLKVLMNNSLVEDKEFRITQKGLDFLQYIEDNNYNDRLF